MLYLSLPQTDSFEYRGKICYTYLYLKRTVLSIEEKYVILIFTSNGQFVVFVGQQSKGI